MPGVNSFPLTTSGAVSAASAGSEPNKPRVYYGFSFRETTGSAGAVFRIRTGGASGDISLAAGESARHDYSPGGIDARDGIYFELVSGTVEGAVRHG